MSTLNNRFLRPAAAFLAGCLLMAAAACAAFSIPVSRWELFARGLTASADADALGTSEENLRVFSRETVDYVTGRADRWEPEISILGLTDFIPAAFRSHMANVRKAFVTVRRLILPLAAAGAALFLSARRHVKRRALFAAGAALPLTVTVLAGLWAALDFNTAWYVIHKLFIPDGFFSASEPVMLLFPETLFSAYLPPVLGLFGLFTAALFLLNRRLFHGKREAGKRGDERSAS